MIKLRPSVLRGIAVALLIVAVLPTYRFARRSYGSFELLRSAYQAGAPATGSIRSWMTLTYVSDAYRVPEPALIGKLELPTAIDPSINLRAAAKLAGVTPFQYVQRVQQAVAALGPDGAGDGTSESSGWLASLSDHVLSELLIYGYPILGLINLAGSIGLPLPDGAASAIAGSLAAQGRMNFAVAAVVVVMAALLGDIVGYAVGLLIDREFLARHGRWVGYTAARWSRVQWLFEEWGLATVFITRTFVSYLSSVASLLAGVSRFPLPKFVAASAAGRLVWTAAYLGLGYVIGADLDAATSFLANFTGFLLCVTVMVAAALVALTSGSLHRRTAS
jgi:membrane protein DedA with SNARE-associated domain